MADSGEQVRNSPEALARILAMTMVTDADLVELEISALTKMRMLDLLGIEPQVFRRVLHDYCSELMLMQGRRPMLRVLEANQIGVAMTLINDAEHRYRTCARLMKLMREVAPAELDAELLDIERINAALDAVDDPHKRIQSCMMMLTLMNADGTLHRNEVAFFNHALERWDISLESLHEVLRERSAAASATAPADNQH